MLLEEICPDVVPGSFDGLLDGSRIYCLISVVWVGLIAVNDLSCVKRVWGQASEQRQGSTIRPSASTGFGPRMGMSGFIHYFEICSIDAIPHPLLLYPGTRRGRSIVEHLRKQDHQLKIIVRGWGARL